MKPRLLSGLVAALASLVFSSCSMLNSDADGRHGAFGSGGNRASEHFANVDLEYSPSFATYTPKLPSYPTDPTPFGYASHPAQTAELVPVSLRGHSHYDFGVVTSGDQVFIANTYGAVFRDGEYVGSVANVGVYNEPMIVSEGAPYEYYLENDWLLADSEVDGERE